jgi:hypothetical protein
MERTEPKKPRVPQPEVIAIRVANRSEKEILLAADGEKFFTEPRYKGFPAIPLRLASIDVEELAEPITDAWRCQAPRGLVQKFDRGSDGRPSGEVS